MPDTETAEDEHHTPPREELPHFWAEETRAKLMAIDDEALDSTPAATTETP